MRLAVVTQTCNLIPRKLEVEGSQVPGSHGLHSKNWVLGTTVTKFNMAKSTFCLTFHGEQYHQHPAFHLKVSLYKT